MNTLDISIQEMCKIEGKASLNVKIIDNKIETCQFAISEYKRFYTKAIEGADIMGLPQLTARICGTCSNAHLLCTIKAVEHALNIIPSEQTIRLRQLLNYGLNIRDHALHLYVFCVPDILNIDNILDLDENIPDQNQLLEDTFIVKSCGNSLSKVTGGRSVHAPYPMVGGFLHLPKQEELSPLISQLEKVRPAVLRLIKLFHEYPLTLNRAVEFAAYLDQTYTFLEGNVQTSDGHTLKEEEFSNNLEHVDIPYSHASGYTYHGKVYMTGALARLNIGKDRINKRTQHDAQEALRCFPSKNIHHNNLAQAIEILHCIDQSIDILNSLKIQSEKPVEVVRKAGTGIAVIEAPRGALYYSLDIDEKGVVTHGDIIVPTGQNQIGIEQSIKDYLEQNLDKEKAFLELEIEKIVRAYDPCMSCASHFLTVNWG